MNSSRAVVQKPAIVLILPAVQILCVAMALLVELIRKLTGGVSFEVNKFLSCVVIVNLTFHHPLSFKQKLDSFIAQINQLKSKIQTFSVQKAIKERVRNTLNKQASYEHERSQSEISSEGLRVESVSDCTQTKVEHKQKSCDKHKLLRVTSFACITFVYTQFIFLIFLLSQSQFRLGVAFLLICTSITSYFILQVNILLDFWTVLGDNCAIATSKISTRTQSQANQTWKIMLKHSHERMF